MRRPTTTLTMTMVAMTVAATTRRMCACAKSVCVLLCRVSLSMRVRCKKVCVCLHGCMGGHGSPRHLFTSPSCYRVDGVAFAVLARVSRGGVALNVGRSPPRAKPPLALRRVAGPITECCNCNRGLGTVCALTFRALASPVGEACAVLRGCAVAWSAAVGAGASPGQ